MYKNSLALMFCLISSLATASDKKPVSIAIIGAGATGAKIASLLEKYGEKVETQIFEAKSHVGGRTFSRQVTLSNGKKVSVNTGTQMNFSVFPKKISPELSQIQGLFHQPPQNILLASGSNLTVVPRVDPRDPERSTEIGQALIKADVLTGTDTAYSGLAASKLDRAHLRDLPFDDMIAYYKRMPLWDQISAHDFVHSYWRPKLKKHTSFGNWIKASAMAGRYYLLPKGLEKADLGADILENSLYWGTLNTENSFGFAIPPLTRRVSEVYFTANYTARMIESMESLVEFTDLHSMSALNFLWQLKWGLHGGPMIVAKDWSLVPKFYIKNAPSAKIHFDSRITNISKNSVGKFMLESINKDLKTKTFSGFDLVINTTDTDTALEITATDLMKPELKELLEHNTYTSTVSLHIEIDTKALPSPLNKKAPALVAEPGYLKHLGGMTFLSSMSGQKTGDKEVVGLFAQSDIARKLMTQAREDKWSHEKLGQETFKILITDLKNLSSKINDPSFKELIKILDNAKKEQFVSVKPWWKALPHFGVGHMKKAQSYSRIMGDDGLFYMGQSLYGRSIAMVLPGAQRDFARISRYIDKELASKKH